MSATLNPGAQLRAAWNDETIAIPGAFNALTALLAERLGFRAVYVSGGALSAGWAGLPDVGLLTSSEFSYEAGVIARATQLPVLADADTGFGETVNVARTVAQYEAAGLAGLHLEDQVLPKRCGHLSGKAVVPTAVMVQKIQAAVQARRDPDFVIIARTDVRSLEGIGPAMERARAYADAGADLIFPEALESAAEFAQFAQSCPIGLIANMTEFGKSPLLGLSVFRDLGYRAVLYPLTAFRAAMFAVEQTLQALKSEGTQKSQLAQMQTRERLYDLIRYRDWEEQDRSLFSHRPAVE